MSESNQALDTFGTALVSQIEEAFPDAIREVINALGEFTIVVDRAAITRVCAFLRDNPELAFNYMCDLSAVDLWPEHPRFEVNVHLLALPPQPEPGQGARRLRVKVRLDEHDARMQTLSGIWASTAWYERETQELFGIEFQEHPDMRPLLLPEDWDSTPPLRRDVPVHVEEVAFSFNRKRIYGGKPFAEG